LGAAEGRLKEENSTKREEIEKVEEFIAECLSPCICTEKFLLIIKMSCYNMVRLF